MDPESEKEDGWSLRFRLNRTLTDASLVHALTRAQAAKAEDVLFQATCIAKQMKEGEDIAEEGAAPAA